MSRLAQSELFIGRKAPQLNYAAARQFPQLL
jgi:hypothetical protein